VSVDWVGDFREEVVDRVEAFALASVVDGVGDVSEGL
jgi:hypothetical protein